MCFAGFGLALLPLLIYLVLIFLYGLISLFLWSFNYNLSVWRFIHKNIALMFLSFWGVLLSLYYGLFSRNIDSFLQSFKRSDEMRDYSSECNYHEHIEVSMLLIFLIFFCGTIFVFFKLRKREIPKTLSPYICIPLWLPPIFFALEFYDLLKELL